MKSLSFLAELYLKTRPQADGKQAKTPQKPQAPRETAPWVFLPPLRAAGCCGRGIFAHSLATDHVHGEPQGFLDCFGLALQKQGGSE